MARASKKAPAARKAGSVASVRPAATTAPALDGAVQVGTQMSTQWARDAIGASLGNAQSLFELLQAMQQLQARALLDAASDVDRAMEAIEEAEDAGALAAVPGQLFNAQWQHALEHTGQAATRLFELETHWLQQLQSQTVRQLSALGQGGNGAAAVATAAPSTGKGADDGAKQWQQWIDQWQHGVADLSRAWNEAVRTVQPRV